MELLKVRFVLFALPTLFCFLLLLSCFLVVCITMLEYIFTQVKLICTYNRKPVNISLKHQDNRDPSAFILSKVYTISLIHQKTNWSSSSSAYACLTPSFANKGDGLFSFSKLTEYNLLTEGVFITSQWTICFDPLDNYSILHSMTLSRKKYSSYKKKVNSLGCYRSYQSQSSGIISVHRSIR